MDILVEDVLIGMVYGVLLLWVLKEAKGAIDANKSTFNFPTIYSTPPHPDFDEWIKESIEDDITNSDSVREKIKMQKETIKLLRIKLSNVSVRHSDLIRDLMRENQELWDQKLRDSEELIRLKQAMIEEEE
jgi:hypothetical protein